MHRFTPLILTVPAGTPQASPVSAAWTLYPGRVPSFRIDIPRGHSGLTGVRIVYKGTPVVPFDSSQYLIGDGTTFTVPWEDEIMNTGLTVQGFNTDIYSHQFRLWAVVDPYGNADPGYGRDSLARPAAASLALAAVGGLGSYMRGSEL